MSGNQHGWGHQQSWAPPQHGGKLGHPSYPGYPTPQPTMVTLRLWHFLLAASMIFALVVINCSSVGVWMFAGQGDRGEVAVTPVGSSSNSGSSNSTISSGDTSNDGTVHTDIAPIDSNNSTVIPTTSSPAATNTTTNTSAPSARQLKISYVPRVGGSTGTTSAAQSPVAPPEVKTISWRVKEDPPATPIPDVVADISFNPGSQVAFANWPWPQLVVKDRKTVNYRSVMMNYVWNLATGKGLAAFPFEQFNSRDGALLAISPDGTQFAIQAKGAGDEFMTVASLSTGKVEKTFEVSIKRPEWIRFADANRLIVAGGDFGARSLSIEIHTPADGKVVKIDHDRINTGSMYAISPGGEYLAVRSTQDGEVLLFETESGDFAGEMQLTFSGSGSRELRGFAFSPDGGKLGCVVQDRMKQGVYYLAGVDVAKGENSFSHIVNVDAGDLGTTHKDTIPAFQWLADGRRCLLFGQQVFDTTTGAGLARPLEGRLETMKAYVSNNGQVQQVDREQLNAAWLYGDRLLFRSVSPKLSAVDLDSATLADGGAVVDPNSDGTDLPLESTDVGGVAEVIGSTVNWDLPQTSAALVASPVTLMLPDADEGGLNSICFSKAPLSKLLVTKYVPGYHVGRGNVYPFDVSSGLPLSPFTLPRACEVMGMSDADQALTINRADELRVDLWSTVDGAHQRGWQPYAGSIGEGRKVAWADFASDGRILTLSQNGTLICWEADAAKAVFRRKLNSPSQPQMNATKSWFVTHDGQELLIVDATSGHNLGSIALPGSEVSSLALRGDDRMLAAVLKLPDGTEQLCICDLSAGKELTRFAPSGKIDDVAWFGDQHLLVNGGAVIDLNEGMHVWSFPLNSMTQLGESAGCIWLFDRTRVIGCKLADLSSGRDVIGAFAGGATPLFDAGDEVAFSGDSGFESSAQRCIESAGYRFNSSARRRLRVSVSSESTSRSMGFGRTIEEDRLKARVELIDESGAAVWSTEFTTTPTHVMSEFSSQMQAMMRRNQQRECASRLATVSLPQNVFRVGGEAVALPGTTSIKNELYGDPSE